MIAGPYNGVTGQSRQITGDTPRQILRN